MTDSIEKRAATVEEATEAALKEFGVGPDEVDVEVLNEGRRGLFGSGRRAHVRVTVRSAARVEPSRAASRTDGGGSTTTELADESTDTGSPDATDDIESGKDEGEAIDAQERLRQLNEEADVAADFVEGILDIMDLPGDIEIEVDESQAFVNVIEVGSGLLIGRRGATLDALQELVRSATQRQVERRSHVRVDVEGYRQRQLEKLKDKCRDGIAQARESGEPVRLEPMDAYERKVMHDIVASTGGVTSASEGVEPRRRVVIVPESVEAAAEGST